MTVVWVIGGSDSSGAAGVQADLRALSAFDVHGATVLTSVTAQGLTHFNTQYAVTRDLVAAQLDALTGELAPAAIKLGMLATAEIVDMLAARLSGIRAPVVIDPVLRSTSGAALLDASGVERFVRTLLPRADVLTPNLFEAMVLTGMTIRSTEDLPRVADALLSLGPKAVVIKGGHAPDGEFAHDYFASASRRFWLTGPRHAAECRGTGCTFAAAVAAMLARGETAPDAVVCAKAHITRAIRDGALLTDQGPRVLGAAHWPVTAADLPWATPSLALARARPSFPDCGKAPLGFYPIVDAASWLGRLAPLGIKTAQLRVKHLSGDALRQEIATAIRIANAHDIRLFINDHWRLAIELVAYGVHLGQEDLLDADVAAIASAGLRLGLSTHSYYEAAVANAFRPSYVALGPIFATTCKSMSFGPQGVPRIAEWRALFSQPLVAIGGMRPEIVSEARARGADSVAVISDVLQNADPEARARVWLEAFA